ncbi:uncharacterized protein BKA78DRAFT_69414 [Phyllosticta capitalensis]|uniref:uncharacterized protein n=1 Tax=Phyllosticta capitalensis TaxID=121624 RepID=UPI00312DD17C
MPFHLFLVCCFVLRFSDFLLSLVSVFGADLRGNGSFSETAYTPSRPCLLPLLHLALVLFSTIPPSSLSLSSSRAWWYPRALLRRENVGLVRPVRLQTFCEIPAFCFGPHDGLTTASLWAFHQ